jgi:hypothetical protein
MISGKTADMRAYEGTNPMQFQDQAKLPLNYAGEFSAGETAAVAAGLWYYDKSANQLVYRVSHYPLYEGDIRKELRYRLQFSDAANDLFTLHLSAVEEET